MTVDIWRELSRIARLMPSSIRVPSRGARALLALAAGAVIAVTLLEVFARLAGMAQPDLYEQDPLLGSRLRPGMSVKWRREASNLVETNELGLRDAPGVGPTRPADAVRVLVLGDSFVEALQVPLAETFVQRLEHLLDPAPETGRQRVEFVNMGCSGYGTAQSYLRFRRDWAAYDPDLVVLCYFAGNDASDNSSELAADRARPFFHLTDDGELVGPDLSFWEATAERRTPARIFMRGVKNKSAALSWLMYERWRARMIEDRLVIAEAGRSTRAAASRQARLFTDPDTDPAVERASRLTLALVSAFVAEARAAEVPFALVTVPAAMQIYPEEAAQVRRDYPEHQFDFDRWDTRLHSLCEREGTPFLAAAPALRAVYAAQPEQPLHFERYGHFTRAGHIAFADAVAGFLAGAYPQLVVVPGP